MTIQSGLVVQVVEVHFDSHEEVMEELRFGASSQGWGGDWRAHVSSYLLMGMLQKKTCIKSTSENLQET